ncbi:LCP family protein [Streptomyces sp. NPDC126933]|uniref:LCP family glycopolymer transferase n=1 Tax=unclassified Streptomyces TaxID=2593676 RepID=UPI003647EBA8
MTDSAGTPAEQDNPSENERPADAPGADDDGAADATSAGSDEPADEPAKPDAERNGSGETTPGSEEIPDPPETTAAGSEEIPDPPETTAAESEETADPPGTTAADGPEAAAPVTAHADAAADGAAPRPHHKRRWLRWTALGTSVVVLAAAGAGWWFYKKLDGNITTDTTAAAELRTYEKERPTPIALDAKNILLLGSDSRSGDNGKYGRDDGGSQRSDTTILLHLAADRQSATAISIPRDLMVDIPSCLKSDGTRSGAQFAQFNWAFEFGGAACTIRTIEKLTGIRVDHHMVIDFSGFKDMVNAVDGVEVCLKEPVDDEQAHLELPAGRTNLNGEQALGFVRARHGIGDGSDTQRMDRQQRFLGALFKKVQSDGVLLNPTRLYPVLDAATKSLTTDPGLSSLKDLYDLARSMRSVPIEKVQFLTVPRQPYTADPNRDELVQPAAKNLFKRLSEDDPVTVSPSGKSEKSADSGKSSGDKAGDDSSSTEEKSGDSDQKGPSPTPTFTGSNAAAGMCE